MPFSRSQKIFYESWSADAYLFNRDASVCISKGFRTYERDS
jgi:hypothetical protein